MKRSDIQAELRRAQADFHDLVGRASPQDLRRRSDGTRWTNRQLLWHMVFGYLIVRTLLPLVHTLGRLGRSRRFAATLDAAHRPFHWINYAGSAGGCSPRAAWPPSWTPPSTPCAASWMRNHPRPLR